MNVWDGPLDRGGSDDSLMLLYYLVSAAEELDLLDQHDRERAEAENARHLREVIRPDLELEAPEEPPRAETPAEDPEVEPKLTDRQAIRVLHELLGAELLEDGETHGEQSVE